MEVLRFRRVLALRILTWHLDFFFLICALLLYDLRTCTYRFHFPPDQELKKNFKRCPFCSQSVKHYLKKIKLASQHILLQASTAIVSSSFSAVYDTENYGFGMSSRVMTSVRNFVKIGQLIQKFNRTQLAHARQPDIINPTACHFRKESAPLYVGGLINFASTVIFFIYEYMKHIWIKPVLCSHMVSLFHRTSP